MSVKLSDEALLPVREEQRAGAQAGRLVVGSEGTGNTWNFLARYAPPTDIFL